MLTNYICINDTCEFLVATGNRFKISSITDSVISRCGCHCGKKLYNIKYIKSPNPEGLMSVRHLRKEAK